MKRLPPKVDRWLARLVAELGEIQRHLPANDVESSLALADIATQLTRLRHGLPPIPAANDNNAKPSRGRG